MINSNAKNNILKKLRYTENIISTEAISIATYQWKKIEEPVAQLKALLAANHAVVVDSREELVVQNIGSIINAAGYRNVLASERVHNQYPKMIDVADSLPQGSIEAWKDFLFNEVDVGITGATGAIATTGTLVLCPGYDEPRSLSLVPPCHIVIVHEETLRNDLAEILQMEIWNNMPTNLVLVSGPSKTADIQQTLAYGAHGPRELFVIFVSK